MWRDTVWGRTEALSQKRRGCPLGSKRPRHAKPEPLSEYEEGVRKIMEQRVEAWLTAKLAQRRRIA